MSETNDKKYTSLNSLQVFLDNLKIIFADASHTHTKDEIVDLNIQEIVDEVIERLPDAEGESF
jgi:hypothetical protein